MSKKWIKSLWFIYILITCPILLFPLQTVRSMSDSGETSEVFRTSVDPKLRDQIDEFCETIRAKELTPALEAQITNLIKGFKNKGRIKVRGEEMWARDKVLKDLRDIGTPTIPLLERALTDKDPLIRDGAIIALNYVIRVKKATRRGSYISSVKDCIPIFIRSLNDVDQGVRRGAIAYLANIAFWERDLKPLIVPHIVKMLDDASHPVAYQAAVSLVKLGKRDLVPENLLKEVGNEVE